MTFVLNIYKNSSKIYLNTVIDFSNKNDFKINYKLRFYGTNNFDTFIELLKNNSTNPNELNKLKEKLPKSHIDLENSLWYNMPSYEYSDDVEEIIIDLLFKEELIETVKNVLQLNNKYSKKQSNTYSFNIPEKPEYLTCYKNKMIICENEILPKYPIYVISLGRYDDKLRLTSKWLDRCKIPYNLVCEPHEEKEYTEAISKCNIGKVLVLPSSFSKTVKRGGVPARNWVYQHSKNNGAKYHWILDDNIDGYVRRTHYQRIPVYSGVVFKSIEDYVERYTNVKLAGHHYTSMTPAIYRCSPVRFNTRIYSSILICNDIENTDELWHGKYNEDTDLSIRQLIAKNPTVLFCNFTANKAATGQLKKGGNFDSIYMNGAQEAFRLKAEEIKDRWDGVDGCKIVIKPKFSKEYHHEIQYPNPDNKLILKDENMNKTLEPNNYGMIYVDNTYKKVIEDDDDNEEIISVEEVKEEVKEVKEEVKEEIKSYNMIEMIEKHNKREIELLKKEQELLKQLENIKKELKEIRTSRDKLYK